MVLQRESQAKEGQGSSDVPIWITRAVAAMITSIPSPNRNPRLSLMCLGISRVPMRCIGSIMTVRRISGRA